jgi:hypothetical protein
MKLRPLCAMKRKAAKYTLDRKGRSLEIGLGRIICDHRQRGASGSHTL